MATFFFFQKHDDNEARFALCLSYYWQSLQARNSTACASSGVVVADEDDATRGHVSPRSRAGSGCAIIGCACTCTSTGRGSTRADPHASGAGNAAQARRCNSKAEAAQSGVLLLQYSSLLGRAGGQPARTPGSSMCCAQRTCSVHVPCTSWAVVLGWAGCVLCHHRLEPETNIIPWPVSFLLLLLLLLLLL